MANISIDGDKLINEGNNLNQIAKDYEVLMNEFYSKISGISANETWLSESANGSANVFMNNVLKSADNMKSISSDLKSISIKLIELGKKINTSADNII